MATQQQFRDFLSDIEPSNTTKENASNAHAAPRDHLKSHDKFKKYHVSTFLSGSYKRDTAIRPRVHDGQEDRADVDVIVVTNHKKTDKPEEVICLLHRTLQEKYDDIKKNVRSVTIVANGINVDIVPIIAPDGLNGRLFIPDRNLSKWVETNPIKHTQWTIDTNEAADGRFKPLVKLVKWWKRENPTGFRKPKGFQVECVVAECMEYGQAQYQELFVGTLEGIVSRYQPHIDAGVLPFIADPGVAGNSVIEGMTFEEFNAFHNTAKKHAKLGREAINEADPEKETEKWRKVFGERFPACTSRTAEGLLTTAAVSSSLFFPNKAIDPTKKPRGFA
jgi:predicted nucleotidyltransferase